MSVTNLNVGGYKQITATGNVSPQPCGMLGIFVSSASATPVIQIFDSATTTTTRLMVDSFTPVSGTWYPLPFSASAGLYIIVSGTLSATVSFA